MMTLNNLKPSRGAHKKNKRVGRGNASGKGTTAGRGTKGQKARTGGRNKLKAKGVRRLVMQTPKLRGFRSIHAKKISITFAMIENNFHSGSLVSPQTLFKHDLIASSDKVKILATGKLTKKVKIAGCSISENAKKIVEDLGGEVMRKSAKK